MASYSPASPKQIVILGATGSIGSHTVDVILRHPDRFQVLALVARQNIEALWQQTLQLQPKMLIIEEAAAAQTLTHRLKERGLKTQVLSGPDAMAEVVSLPEVDVVVSAITGAAGLLPTLAALRAGKRVLLANKESMVMAGPLIAALLKQSGAQLLPIDSEHNAIFQVLPDDYDGDPIKAGINRVCLTASGGALRDLSVSELSHVTPEMALKHPNWSMGPKVTIDSATMMNKGLELIEAAWLFNLSPDLLDVVVHPQSLIHSMVEYRDGSQLVHMAHADMRVPITQALGYPDRLESGVGSLDWTAMGTLTFEAVDAQRYPCLFIAKAALEAGGTAPTILNAANEMAVEAFLNHRLNFTDIAHAVDATLQKVSAEPVVDLTSIQSADRLARLHCWQWIQARQERP